MALKIVSVTVVLLVSGEAFGYLLDFSPLAWAWNFVLSQLIHHLGGHLDLE
jgi:hypothetical protein